MSGLKKVLVAHPGVGALLPQTAQRSVGVSCISPKAPRGDTASALKLLSTFMTAHTSAGLTPYSSRSSSQIFVGKRIHTSSQRVGDK